MRHGEDRLRLETRQCVRAAGALLEPRSAGPALRGRCAQGHPDRDVSSARSHGGQDRPQQRLSSRLKAQLAAAVHYRAESSVSPVRMRTTRCSSLTKILPSPTLPVFAVFTIASITGSTRSLRTAISTRALGTKSTTYSAPR